MTDTKTPAQVRTILAVDQLDNTSDADKPVSTAGQAALDLKSDTSAVLTKADNLASLASAPTARTSLGLGDAAVKDEDDLSIGTATQAALDAKASTFTGLRTQHFRELASARDTLPKAAVVILLGQSLNAARGSIAQSAANGKTMMFVGGAHASAWGFWSTNVENAAHYSEMASSVVLAEGGDGQSPCAGVGAAIVGGVFDRSYVCSIAIGSRGIDKLSAGGPKANLAAAIERGCALAVAAGYDPQVMFYSAHGEADATASMSEDDYYAKAKFYYEGAQLQAAQFMGKPRYQAPVILTQPILQQNEDARSIKEAIRRIAHDTPGVIDLGSIYQWPAETDRIHPTPTSYVMRGEAIGKAFRSYFESGDQTIPLEIVDVTWDGSTEFVATFNAPIVKDTTLNVGQNLVTTLAEDGFEWIDNGSQVAVTAISYEGYKVRGTLGAGPSGTTAQQVLRIAEQTTPSTLTAGATNLAGSIVRADKDGWPSIIDHTYDNRVWAMPQRFTNVRDA